MLASALVVVMSSFTKTEVPYIPIGPLIVIGLLIVTFTADCETTALPEILPGFPTVKPVTPLEGCRKVAKLNDPLKESL